jgi:TatA/E family protein of Tat protein translocase
MNLGPAEIGLIVLAVMLLFGYKKLPDASRSLGRSLRIFKGEVDGLREGVPPSHEDLAQRGRAGLADRGSLPGGFGVTEVGQPAAQHPVELLGADDLTGRRPGAGVGKDGALLRPAEPAVGPHVRLEG